MSEPWGHDLAGTTPDCPAAMTDFAAGRSTDCDLRVEVLVLGGGPAGAATALALARLGRSVAILARPHDRPARAGETLPPEIRSLLEMLGLWEPFLRDGHIVWPGIVSVWGHSEPTEADFIFNPFGRGWHIDRVRFDAMLVRAAEERGVISLRSTRPPLFSRTPREWRFEAEVGEMRVRLRTQAVVDATGRSAWLSRRVGAWRIPDDRLLGLVASFPASRRSVEDRRTLVEAVEEGWWYTAALAGDRMAVAFMTDADLLPRGRAARLRFWGDRLDRTFHTSARLQRIGSEVGLLTVPAGTSRLSKAAGDDWLAVGDAAVAIDPLSSQGIYRALVAAVDGADALNRRLSGDRRSLDVYAARVHAEHLVFLRERSAYYGLERRWSDSPFWKRRSENSS